VVVINDCEVKMNKLELIITATTIASLSACSVVKPCNVAQSYTKNPAVKVCVGNGGVYLVFEYKYGR